MTEIREIRAGELSEGSLAGFAYTCRCTLVLTSTLRTALEIDVAVHERWHAGTDRGALAPIPGIGERDVPACYCPSDCTCRNADRLTICGCERHAPSTVVVLPVAEAVTA